MAALAGAEEEAAKGYEVWRVNWPIVEAFCKVGTQWRTAAMPDGRVMWLGLDYTAVRARLGRLSDERWRGLEIMEREASKALNGVAG